jgi:hypothetical protein
MIIYYTVLVGIISYEKMAENKLAKNTLLWLNHIV